MIKFTPFPELTTERLLLRQLKEEDDNEILFLRSDKRILAYIDIPVAKTKEDARMYIRKMNTGITDDEWILWGITLKDNESLVIGTICLWNISRDRNKAEIGYVLHPDFQGKGIMQEAVEQVIDYGFDIMNLDVIDADLHKDNKKSLKLLERNNFIHKKNHNDFVVYLLRKTDWIVST